MELALLSGLLGVLIGAGVTLYTSRKANEGAEERFNRQLAADAELRRKDRLQQKIGVYLEATSEFVKVAKAMGGMASANPEDGEALTRPLVEFVSAASKASLVASDSTRSKITSIVDFYGRFFMECLAKASVVHDIFGDKEINREFYNLALQESRDQQSALRDVEQTVNSRYNYDALIEASERTRERMAALSEDFIKIADDLNAAHKEYSLWLLGALSEAAPLQDAALVAMRAEIDESTDEDALATSKERMEIVGSSMKHFLAGLNREAPKDRS